jgi:hypothetical protein
MMKTETQKKPKTRSFPQWLQSHTESRTKQFYTSIISYFLKSIYGTDEGVEPLAAKYIKEVKEGKRDVDDELTAFVTFAKAGKERRKNKPMPTNVLRPYLAVSRKFIGVSCGVAPSEARSN